MEDPESFLEQEPLVNNLMKMLDDISNSNKSESQGVKKQIETNIEDEPSVDDFIFTDSSNIYSSVKSSRKTFRINRMKGNVNKLTIVRQFEKDEEKRAEVRRECEYLANNFRQLGNHSYSIGKYSDAIDYYTKGLECIHDTPVLYCNRSLCYVKLAKYKRALMDLHYVINKLDRNCLKAWLYRAGCYWRLGDEVNFQKSIDFARQYNINEREYIATFVERMKTEF